MTTTNDTSASMAAFRLLVAAGNRIDAEAEEFEGPDGMTMGVGLSYWHEFDEALERARDALESPSSPHALAAQHQAMPTSEQLRVAGVIADKIEDGSLFNSGIYSNAELAGVVRSIRRAASTAVARGGAA